MGEVQSSTERRLQFKEIGPCKYEIQVAVPPEDVKSRLESRYRELNDTVQFPGFRRGHTPRPILEKRFGKDVATEVKAALIEESIQEARDKHDLVPLDEPEVDLSKIDLSEGAGCALTFTIEVKPKIAFDAYKGIPLRKPEIVVTDAEIEEALGRLREAKAELVVAPDGRVAEHDQVIGDLDMSVDGTPFQKAADAAFFVSGSMAVFNLPAPDLARALLGRGSGDEVAVPIVFPKEHPDARLAGKTAQLAVKVKEVKRRQLPSLTDDWAKEMGFDDLGALRNRVRERLHQEKEVETRRRQDEDLMAEARRRAAVALPAGVVEKESLRFLKRRAMDLYLKGMPEEEISQHVAQQQAASQDAVAIALQNHFLYEHIAGIEKIYVTESDVEDYISQIAARYGRWPHEVKKHLEKNDQLPDLRRKLREEKVLAFLREHAALA
jgi:trigger factor